MTGIRRWQVFALRGARDAKTHIVTGKLINDAIAGGMSGVALLFRGQRGADTLAGWNEVMESALANEIRGKRVRGLFGSKPKQMPAKAVDHSGYTQLRYIEQGKPQALALIEREQQEQQQVLATARCFATLIEELAALSAAGPAHRERIIALGGAQLLVNACCFIRDEELLLQCVECLFRLSHEFALRRQLVKDGVRAHEALAAVLCRPHVPAVLRMTLDTLDLLCIDGDIAATLPVLGVFNAICALALKAAPEEVGVLHSACTLMTSMGRDAVCAKEMTAKGPQLLSAMFRLLRVCRDAEVCSMACAALASVCDGHLRILMGRHPSVEALLLVVERAALQTEEQASQKRRPACNEVRPAAVPPTGDFVAGTCSLISRLCEIKEVRDKLVRQGLVHPLVALVLMSQASSPAAKAAQMAVKTVEVDEVYRRQVEAVVDEYVANLSLGGGSSVTGSGRSHASHIKSVASSTLSSGSRRVHWTDRLAGVGRGVLDSDEAGDRPGGVLLRADKDLLLKYLGDQSEQRELALAEVDRWGLGAMDGGMFAVDEDLDGLEEVEEDTQQNMLNGASAETPPNTDVDFLTYAPAESATGGRQPTAATGLSKPSSSSRAATAFSQVRAETPEFRDGRRREMGGSTQSSRLAGQGARIYRVPSSSSAKALPSEVAVHGEVDASAARGADSTPLSHKSTKSLQEVSKV